MRLFWIRMGVVIIILIITSLLVIGYDIDIKLARLLVGPDNSWPGNKNFFWMGLYKFAPVPGLLLAICSLGLFCLGYYDSRLEKIRRQAVFFILLALLGPGLMVNVILKDNLGRPRPRELVEFGGKHEFVQPMQLGNTGKNSSFPSGHASIAFFLIAPWFIYRNNLRKIAFCFLVSGLFFGILVGFGRMLQGGHFLSDVIWAGGIVYLTGELLSRILPSYPIEKVQPDIFLSGQSG